ncbi:hypothetical protein ScPMuIL_011280 [Solemya velum]
MEIALMAAVWGVLLGAANSLRPYEDNQKVGAWSGTIHVPYNYTSPRTSRWVVTVREGSRVKLEVLGLDIRPGMRQDMHSNVICIQDYVQLMDNQTLRKSAKYCQSEDEPWVSDGNSVIVTFVSHNNSDNGVKVYKGFNISYTGECGGNVTSDMTLYPPPASVGPCEWNVTFERGSISAFNILQKGSNSTSKYWQIWTMDRTKLLWSDSHTVQSDWLLENLTDIIIMYNNTSPSSVEDESFWNNPLDIVEMKPEHPCFNESLCRQGTCVPRKDVASEYDCECEEGFEGDYCDTKITTACQSNPCQHGGTCNEVGGTFKCTCVDNFEGNSCTEFKYPASEYCEGEIDDIPGSGIEWWETYVDSRSVRPCPPGINGNATRFCMKDSSSRMGRWERPDLAGCVNPIILDISRKAELLMTNEDGSKRSFLNVTKTLGQVIGREDGTIFLYPGDLSMAADTVRTLADVVQFSSGGKTEFQDIMKVIIEIYHKIEKS